jgi:hypothetical protein
MISIVKEYSMTKLFVDFNNLCMAKCFSKDVEIKTEHPNYALWEFYVFETMYDYIRKFKATEVIIARDNQQYWRKKYFPRYKEKRADAKDKDVDWDTFFGYMDQLFSDLHTYFPFKCLNIKYCEGDDIIGHLATVLEGDLVILSADQDLKQVVSDQVTLYSLMKDEYIPCADPARFLEEACFTGQAKDGIFNVITPEDWPVGERKPGFGPAKLEKWRSTGLDIMLNKMVKYKKGDYKGDVLPADRVTRNRVLMDFTLIPKIIINTIEKCYNEYQLSEIGKLYGFFESKNWTRFIQEYQMTEN